MNVIAVDWKIGAAAPNYFAAVDNVKICGFNISIFALKNKMNPGLVHCIGHSLGLIILFFELNTDFNQLKFKVEFIVKPSNRMTYFFIGLIDIFFVIDSEFIRPIRINFFLIEMVLILWIV